jgi:hypothetical protein
MENTNLERKSTKKEEVARPKRIPLSRKSLLDHKQIPGFYLRFVSDDKPGKMQGILDAGYSYVEEPNEKGELEKVKRYAGVNNEGKAYYMFLMKLPQEYRNEDLQEKRRISQAVMESMNLKNKEFEIKENAVDINKLSVEQLKQLKEQLKNV